MQCHIVIWILSAFCMSLSFSIEAITDLIPVKFYLQKLCGRSQLRAHSLPTNYIIRLLLNSLPSYITPPHPISLVYLKPKQ